ncbi:MAG: S8 family serine peptidase [Thermoguttaceae bacterium]
MRSRSTCSARRTLRCVPRRLALEPLEVRCLLSASTPGELYGSGWTVDYLAAGQAEHAAPPGISAEDLAASAAPSAAAILAANTYDWIVAFNTASLASIDSAARTAGLLPGAGISMQVVEGLGREGEVLVRSFGATAAAVSTALRADRNVESFELDSVQQFTSIPNDPKFSQEWALQNTGQASGTPGADIHATAAWSLATGSRNVVVAVIDSGVDYTHPDLAANIWTNPAAGADGYSGDLHGYDFADNSGNVMDNYGHGTFVAGAIAAVGNNGQGVSGVDWSASIMALKFLDANGQGYTSDAIRAVNYMTMMRTVYHVNVCVANASWTSGTYDPALDAAIAAAGNAGILFVTAAGNSGANNDISPQYPANDRLPNVIAVAASDRNDRLAAFSDYGAATVDLAAPGVSIYSTLPGNSYGTLSGTSMATPQVSGVAALCWALNPNATVAQVRSAILAGVDKVPSLSGKVVSGGRLDAYNTLRLIATTLTPTPAITSLQANPGAVPAGGTVALAAQGVSETGGTIAGVSFYQDTDGNGLWDSGDRLTGSTGTIAAGQATFTMSTAGMTPGAYHLFARAVDAAGRWSAAVAASLTVTAASGSAPATAAPLTVGSALPAAIRYNGGVDFFKFQAVAGRNYVFQTALGTLHDSILTLFASNGQTMLAQNDDIAPGNYASRIAWQATTTGTYYLAVAAYPGSGTGTFSLQSSAGGSAPVLSAVADQTLRSSGSLLVALQGRDPGGNPLTYTAQAVASAGAATVSVTGNMLTVRPAASFTGRFQVQVTASDGLLTTTNSFWVTVGAAGAGSQQAIRGAAIASLSGAASVAAVRAEGVDQAISAEPSQLGPTAVGPLNLRALAAIYMAGCRRR